MGNYYYFVCRQSKKYLCLGKKMSAGHWCFQGLYSDASNEWVSDDRLYQCIARFVLENPECDFVFANESNIPEIDDYDEMTFDELASN